MNTDTNAEAVLQEYYLAAAAYGKSLGTGNHIQTNLAHQKATEKFQELHQMGRERDVLIFLTDENSSVRCWAATHGLEIDPSRAEPILESIANGSPSPIRLIAQIKLSEWRKKKNG